MSGMGSRAGSTSSEDDHQYRTKEAVPEGSNGIKDRGVSSDEEAHPAQGSDQSTADRIAAGEEVKDEETMEQQEAWNKSLEGSVY